MVVLPESQPLQNLVQVVAVPNTMATEDQDLWLADSLKWSVT